MHDNLESSGEPDQEGDPLMERTAYDILGVSRTAPAEVMKAAKTALAKIYHPDTEAMTQVNEAYDILTDPERRSIHDSFHAAGGSDGAPAGDTGPGWGDDPVAPDSGNEGWGDESPETDTGASTAAEGPWETYSSPPSPPPVAATHIQAQTPLQQGWTSALQLANAIRAGHPLPSQQSTLVLGQGEIYHCGVSAELAAYYGLDEVSYNNNTFVAGRTLTGMAVTGAASMMFNSHSKKKAQRQAAPQWRREGVVPLHVTNQRMLMVHEGQLNSYWFGGGIASFDPQFHQYSMTLQADGGPPLHFSGPAVPYVAVILHILLRGYTPTLQ